MVGIFVSSMDLAKHIASRAAKGIRMVLAQAPPGGSEPYAICAEKIDLFNTELHRLLRDAYDRLAQESHIVGDDDKTRIWQALRNDCGLDDHAPHKPDQSLGIVATLEHLHFDALNELANARHATLSSPYAMWNFAVRNQTSVRDAFIGLAAYARTPAARDRALFYARRAMDRAADYRILRRAAYHADQSGYRRAAFLPVNRVQSVRDLEHIALAIERWCASLLKARTDMLQGLEEALQLTEETISKLEVRIADEQPRVQLQGAISRLNERAKNLAPDRHSPAQAFHEIHSECERIFDYYNDLFETADDEALLKSAQAMSRVALSRLSLVRAAAVSSVPTSRAS